MKFLCSLFGHLGPNATHACLLCEAPSTSFKEHVAGEEQLKPAEKTALNRSCKSITKAPLVKINVNCVVPSPLHIILGLGHDLLNLVQKEAKTLGVEEQLEDVYKRLGADKRSWFQNFCGNHMRKLLTGDGPRNVANAIRNSPKYADLYPIALSSRQIQCYAKACFLSSDEVSMLSSACNICLTFVNAFVQPVMLFIDNYFIFYHTGLARVVSPPFHTFFFPLYVFSYYIVMSSSAVQFFYRYLAICRNIHVSAIKYFCMLGVACLFTLILAGSVLHLFNTIYSILFGVMCYVFIFVSGFKTRNVIKKHKHSKKAENDIQMTLILILQAILPLITGFIVEHLRVKMVFVKKDRRV
uniref:Uncharacterized protein n=1 Tax=Ditylenchus dipsaci TaxID=166011 RepID=A0A915E9U5_9BILA